MIRILLKGHREQITLFGAIFLIMVIVSIVNPSFLSLFNIINIINQASINLVLALGMTFVIIIGGIDLSIGSQIALLGVLGVGLSQWNGVSVLLSILIAVAAGVVIGLINGASIVYLKIAPLIMTLAVSVAVRSVAYIYTDGSNVFPVPEFFKFLSSYIAGFIPIMIIIAVVLAIVAHLVLTKTKYGRYLYAVGGNSLAARFSGINNSLITMVAYVISGFCCALAGILMVARLSSGMPSVGQGTELIVIAAVVIGGTSLKGGKGTIIGTVLGVFLISLISNIVNMLSVPSSFNGIVTGGIIFMAAVVDAFRKDEINK